MHRPVAILSVFNGYADLSATGHQLTPPSLMATPSRPNPVVLVLSSDANVDASQRRPGKSLRQNGQDYPIGHRNDNNPRDSCCHITPSRAGYGRGKEPGEGCQGSGSRGTY